MALPEPLRIFLWVSVALFLLCLVCELICHFVLRLPPPYDWPLTPPNEVQVDLLTHMAKFKAFHHREFFEIEPQYAFAYPAPMALLYAVVYAFHWRLIISFTLFVTAVLSIVTLFTGRGFVRHGLMARSAAVFCVVTLLTSYPFIFELKQGNLEVFVWLILCAGIWLFLKGKGYSSAACFAVAGSLKLFPLIFLGLHIAQQKWRQTTFGILVAIVVSVSSLWLLVPDIPFTWHHLQDAMALLQTKVVLVVLPREIGFDHSLFSLLKRLFVGFVPLRTVLTAYMGVVAVLGTLLFFARIRNLSIRNQVLALTVCAILLPPVSYDYTLIHLYAPFVMLVLAILAGQRQGTTWTLMLFAGSLAPWSELIFHGVRFGGQFRSIFLILLLINACSSNPTRDRHSGQPALNSAQ
jgi:hypothetical protein